MRKSKFTDSQIMDALKRDDAGFGVSDICREMSISTATFYKWRAKYGGMDFLMMSRIKELEEENRRLKKIYLEEKLKAEIVSEALEKSGEAIPSQGDGHDNSQRAWHLYSGGVPGI
jgi:putative transposase